MILDSSAIVGVVLREPGFEDLVRKIARAEAVDVGAPTLAEADLVLTSRLGRDVRGLLQGLLRDWGAVTVTFGEDHWQEAVAAYARFGRGRHQARLNFGDCLTYAVARLAREPLLCTGEDFPAAAWCSRASRPCASSCRCPCRPWSASAPACSRPAR